MIFTGYYEHTIDKKNRLAIPSKFRSRMDAELDGKGFYVVPGQPGNTLWLYTERHFEALAERAESALSPDPDQLQRDKVLFTLAAYQEIDTQGRILIPERMRIQAGLGREVVICGVRDHAEIMSRKGFEESIDDDWRRFPEYQARVRDAQ